MMSFRSERLRGFALPTSTVWLLTDIAEAKGRQDLYAQQAPQVLRALRETAIIQSAESSNRIEGVTVAPERLRPLILGSARPRDHSEQEVQGYRDALNQIHTRAAELPLTPASLLSLHETIQHGAADAGKWKQVDNDIVELRPNAPPRLRFKTVPFGQAPAAVDELCIAYGHVLEQGLLLPLPALAAFIFDFLCIHPFRDGNGRVSRLLTLLGLYHHGIEVGRYISLERIVEDSREDYYEALRRSSIDWHAGAHDLLPWMNYWLGSIHRAYRDFEERAGQVKAPRGAKRALVETAIKNLGKEFTIADLRRMCPGVSHEMIRLVLSEFRKADRIIPIGRGPMSKWQKR